MQFKYVIAALMVLCLLATPTMMVRAEKSIMGCEICEWLVATAESFVNKTKPQIEQELLQICSKLGPYEQLCDQMVLMELPDIIDAIIAKEPPATVCAQVKICNGSAVAAPAPKDSGICNMCQLVVSQVENWAESNATLAELETKLEQVCNIIPGQYSTLCTYAVENYLPTFLHQVEKNYPALVICQDVHLCSSTQAPKVVAQPKQQVAELCPICKAAVGFLKTKISNVDVATVKKQLEFACTFFQVPDCQQLVDKAAEIAQDIQTEDAATICSTVVDVCPKAQQIVAFNPFQRFLKAKNEKYCPTCLEITKYLEDVVVSDLTTNEIIKLADVGCDALGPLSSLCKKFVPLAVDELKSYIQQKLTPQKICSTLDMCAPSEIMQLAAPKAQDSSMCLACEYVISVADNWLIANNTQQSVQAVLDKVCTDFVPSIYQSQCIALVSQYEAELVQLFESKIFNPQTVCKAIGVCTSQKMQRINQAKQIKMN